MGVGFQDDTVHAEYGVYSFWVFRCLAGLWGRVLKTSAFRGEVLFRQDLLIKPQAWRDYSSLGLIFI